MHRIKVNDPREVYRYKRIETLPKITKISEDMNSTEFEVSFDSVIQSSIRQVNKVYAYYFAPKQRVNKKLCIIVHGHGYRGFKSMFYFAKGLAKSGFTTVLLTLPFHGKRRVRGVADGTGFFVLDSIGMLTRFRQSVIDVRTLIDFSEKGIFGNVEDVSILGLSVGGMISTVAMGSDKRISKGVFVLAGGDVKGIFWKSFSMRVFRQHVYAFEKEQGNSDNRKESVSVATLYDPLTFAPFIAPRKVIMFNGYMDPIIPHFASQKLYEKIENAKITYLPIGHGTILAFRKLILLKTTNFLVGNNE